MKKIKFTILICILIITMVFAVACRDSDKSEKELSKCDFSFNNLKEVRMEVRACTHYEVYSLKKGQGDEDDKIFSEISEAWTAFRKEADFQDIKAEDIEMIIGGNLYYYICEFVDGSTITLINTAEGTFKLNQHRECALKDKGVFDALAESYSAICADKYLIEHKER